LEPNDGSPVLIGLGALCAILGLLLFGDLFWGNLPYLGISWIAAGVIYKLAERELTVGAFFVGLLFGAVGAIIWIVIDISRTQYRPSDYGGYSDTS